MVETNFCQRAVMIQFFIEEGFDSPIEITCDDCGCVWDCPFAFDMYNINGDCLAEK